MSRINIASLKTKPTTQESTQTKDTPKVEVKKPTLSFGVRG